MSGHLWVCRLAVCAVLAAGVVAVPGVAVAQPDAPAPFADVPDDAYYYEPVRQLAEMGVFEGTECEEGFCPGQPLLRREMAVWLVRALEGSGEATDDDSRFVDVEDSWYVPYIERMADLKITAGCRVDPPRFCPDRPVSRGQMASFLSRALELPPAPSAGFADVDHETNVHANNIDRLAAAKITAGCRTEPLSYCPGTSTSRAQMATFIYRALQWRDDNAPRTVKDANPGVFLTEENELSRFIKHEIVDKYADEHPWLMEVWNYTNRPDFEYRQQFGTGVWLSIVCDQEESLCRRDGQYLQTRGGPYGYIDKDKFVHELGHIYSLASDVAHRPGPLAIAHLYFEDLADGRCSSSELYADVAPYLLPEGAVFHDSHYWKVCGHLPSEPLREAVEVARSAFTGEMPQWLYDTFQKTDGSLDYEGLWAAVKDAPRWQSQVSIVYNLKDEFGGYCSNQAVFDSLYYDSELEQPWRDGGCS